MKLKNDSEIHCKMNLSISMVSYKIAETSEPKQKKFQEKTTKSLKT